MKKVLFLALCMVMCTTNVVAEDGSRLWLRAMHNKTKNIKASFDPKYRNTIVEKAADEINRYWHGDDISLVVDNGMTELKDGFRIEEGCIKAACPAGI